MKLDDVQKFILDLSKDGRITPTQIIEAAKKQPKNDQVYLRYWGLSDSDEAYHARLDRARSDLHKFKVVVTTETHRLACPVYVRDPAKEKQGYTSVRSLALRHEESIESYQHELRRLVSWIERVEALGIDLGIAKMITSLPEDFAEMIATLSRYQQMLSDTPKPSAKQRLRTEQRALT